MRPGSYSRPEQALEVLAGDADQGLGDDPQEEYEDALEILPTICGTVDDSNSETSQVGSLCSAQLTVAVECSTSLDVTFAARNITTGELLRRSHCDLVR